MPCLFNIDMNIESLLFESWNPRLAMEVHNLKSASCLKNNNKKNWLHRENVSRVNGSEGEFWTESKSNCSKESAVFPTAFWHAFFSFATKLKSFLRRNMFVCICVYMWAMPDPEILDTDKPDMQGRGEMQDLPHRKKAISNSLSLKYINYQLLALLISFYFIVPNTHACPHVLICSHCIMCMYILRNNLFWFVIDNV